MQPNSQTSPRDSCTEANLPGIGDKRGLSKIRIADYVWIGGIQKGVDLRDIDPIEEIKEVDAEIGLYSLTELDAAREPQIHSKEFRSPVSVPA